MYNIYIAMYDMKYVLINTISTFYVYLIISRFFLEIYLFLYDFPI